jgi:hypothetical protein
MKQINRRSNGKAINRVFLGFRIWIITRFIVIERIKVIETAKLLVTAIFSFFCFDKNVIYIHIKPRKYKKQTIIRDKGFNNYHSFEFLIFKA